MYVNARMRETLSRFNAASSMEALLAALYQPARRLTHGGFPRR